MKSLKYTPTKLNTAQKLLISLGVDDLRLFAHGAGRNESFTKKGPGRKPQHGDGKRQHTLTFAGNLAKVWADKRAVEMRRRHGLEA